MPFHDIYDFDDDHSRPDFPPDIDLLEDSSSSVSTVSQSPTDSELTPPTVPQSPVTPPTVPQSPGTPSTEPPTAPNPFIFLKEEEHTPPIDYEKYPVLSHQFLEKLNGDDFQKNPFTVKGAGKLDLSKSPSPPILLPIPQKAVIGISSPPSVESKNGFDIPPRFALNRVGVDGDDEDDDSDSNKEKPDKDEAWINEQVNKMLDKLESEDDDVKNQRQVFNHQPPLKKKKKGVGKIKQRKSFRK